VVKARQYYGLEYYIYATPGDENVKKANSLVFSLESLGEFRKFFPSKEV
jgi:hypothetical protein